jgi:hypothetical protein
MRTLYEVAVGDEELLARDVQRLLGCDADASRAIARASAAAARKPRGFVGQTLLSVRPKASLQVPDDAAILALPFTTDALAVLGGVRRPMLIEQTPLTSTLGRTDVVTSDVLVARNRERVKPLFVTFPDHHLTADGTTRAIPFLGDDHHFSLLEVLLLARGTAPLVTLRAEGEALSFVTYDGPRIERESDALALLHWLAANLESVLRFAPSHVLSWRSIAQRSAAAVRTRRVLDGHLLQAMIRVRSGMPSTVRGWALERLRSIEEHA